MSLRTLEAMRSYYAAEDAAVDRYLAEFSSAKLPPWSRFRASSIQVSGQKIEIQGDWPKSPNFEAKISIDTARGTVEIYSYQWLGSLPAESRETFDRAAPELKPLIAALGPKIQASVEATRARLASLTSAETFFDSAGT